MASVQIKITKKDGKDLFYDLTPSAKVAFESHFQTGWRKRLIEEQKESDLWWFAHYLQMKKGDTSLEFNDAYIDQFAEIDLVFDSKNG
jgi:hypothetical protein